MTKAVYLLISCSAILDRPHQEANRLQQTAEQIDGPALRATQPMQVLSPLEAMIAANAPAISIAMIDACNIGEVAAYRCKHAYGLGFVVRDTGCNLCFMKLGQNAGYSSGWTSVTASVILAVPS
jgi:hypothetical protein